MEERKDVMYYYNLNENSDWEYGIVIKETTVNSIVTIRQATKFESLIYELKEFYKLGFFVCRNLPSNAICIWKNNHPIDESLIENALFKSEIETECLRCKVPLRITIDGMNEEYTVEEY